MIPATRFERVYGAPFMAGLAYDAARHSMARREASALRSRAYQAGLCPVCGVFPGPEGCACYGPGDWSQCENAEHIHTF